MSRGASCPFLSPQRQPGPTWMLQCLQVLPPHSHSFHWQMERFASMRLVDVNLFQRWSCQDHKHLIVRRFCIFFFLTNFSKLSRCSNSPGIIKSVSIGVREILFLMKWDKIFDLTKFSRLAPMPSPMAFGDGTLPVGATSTCILLLGTRVYENMFSFPHNLLSYCRVACSSFSNTSTKFVAPECTFPSLGFFQHLSSECPNC